jgi:hypothetical protein
MKSLQLIVDLLYVFCDYYSRLLGDYESDFDANNSTNTDFLKDMGENIDIIIQSVQEIKQEIYQDNPEAVGVLKDIDNLLSFIKLQHTHVYNKVALSGFKTKPKNYQA